MASEFTCALITPEAELFSGPVEYVNLPAWDGQMGISANHAPSLLKMGVGTLTLRTPSGETTFIVNNGFAEVANNKLTLLASEAIPAEGLDKAAADAAAKEADEMPDATDREFERKQAAKAKAVAMRQAAR